MQNTETKSVTGKVMKELAEDEACLIDELRLFQHGDAIIQKQYGVITLIKEKTVNIKLGKKNQESKKL